MSPHPRICRGGFRAAIALLFGLCLPLFSGVAGAMIVVGTGLDSVYVTLVSPIVGTRSYEVKFNYNPAVVFDSYAAMSVLDAADNSIAMSWINYGTATTPNFFLNAIQFENNSPEANTPEDPYIPYWVQWVAGGQAGHPTPDPISATEWLSGSGSSAPARVLEPGSNDVFFYSDGSEQPNFAPIPEPGVTWLALAGLGMLFRRRR